MQDHGPSDDGDHHQVLDDLPGLCLNCHRGPVLIDGNGDSENAALYWAFAIRASIAAATPAARMRCFGSGPSCRPV